MDKTVNKNLPNTKLSIIQLVSFNLGNLEFGIEILKVQEILRMIEITTIPDTPHYLKGVINLRGKVIPIIDLNMKIGMNSKEIDSKSRIIVLPILDKIIGFIVDNVNTVLRIDPSIIDSSNEFISNMKPEYISGIGKLENKLIIILDLEKILSSNEIEIL